MVLHQIPDPVIEHDISAFLSSELARVRDDYNSQAFDDQQLPPNWPGEQIIRALVHMAIPLFIFAATVCRFVADKTLLDPAGQLDKVLNYQSGHSDLDKLDATYLHELNQIVADQAEEKSRLVNEFRKIIGPIVLLAEPLSASSLSRLLDIPTKSMIPIFNQLHAVLDIPPRADSQIRPFHLSFRDFLVDPAKRDTNEFWIDGRKVHHHLATVCIQRLGACLQKDICNLKQPGKARIEVNSKDVDTLLPTHVRYA